MICSPQSTNTCFGYVGVLHVLPHCTTSRRYSYLLPRHTSNKSAPLRLRARDSSWGNVLGLSSSPPFHSSRGAFKKRQPTMTMSLPPGCSLRLLSGLPSHNGYCSRMATSESFRADLTRVLCSGRRGRRVRLLTWRSTCDRALRRGLPLVHRARLPAQKCDCVQLTLASTQASRNSRASDITLSIVFRSLPADSMTSSWRVHSTRLVRCRID